MDTPISFRIFLSSTYERLDTAMRRRVRVLMQDLVELSSAEQGAGIFAENVLIEDGIDSYETRDAVNNACEIGRCGKKGSQDQSCTESLLFQRPRLQFPPSTHQQMQKHDRYVVPITPCTVNASVHSNATAY